MTYFDRLMRERIHVPRCKPVAVVWNKELVRERMILENKRGFGDGIVLNTIPFEEKVEGENEDPCAHGCTENDAVVSRTNKVINDRTLFCFF